MLQGALSCLKSLIGGLLEFGGHRTELNPRYLLSFFNAVWIVQSVLKMLACSMTLPMLRSTIPVLACLARGTAVMHATAASARFKEYDTS